MGRFPRLRREPVTHECHDDGAAWRRRYVASARSRGAMPYEVEGFIEVSEAVRRGHPVILRRQAAVVADNVLVFADAPQKVAAGNDVVAVLRFDVSTARFELVDPDGRGDAVQLTPRRLQRYLDDPARSGGVAIGA